MGSNFEIVVNSENIVIKGNRNITVEGNVRELIKGDYIQEIEGDFFQKIHKNHRVKVGAANDDHPKGPGGNREEEIIGNHSFNINDDIKGRVGGDSVVTFEKSKIQVVGGGYDLDVTGKEMDSNAGGDGIFMTTNSNYTVLAKTNISQSTISGIMSLKSGDTLNIKSAAAMTINPETTLSQIVGTNAVRTVAGTLTDTITGKGLITMEHVESEVTARAITLTQHTHTDPAGVSGAETSTPN
jgi:hypothetical protein